MSTTIPGISPRGLFDLLQRVFAVPADKYTMIFLTGMPGFGKTEVIQQACQKAGKNHWAVRPIQHDTVEYTGLPVHVDSRATWAPFEELLPTDPADESIVHVDEFTQLDAASQKVMASLTDKEGVAGRRIPKGARFILSGNRQQDRAGASRLLSIIENRCMQLELLFSGEDWKKWATDHDVDQTVISFADFRGGDFARFDASMSLNPTPRAWFKVSNFVRTMNGHSHSKEDPIMVAGVGGLVGPGPAAEYLAFREHFHLLHNVVHEVFDSPQNVDLTDDLSVKHALIGAVTARLKDTSVKLTDKQLANVVKFGEGKLPKSLQAVLCLNCMLAQPKRFSTLREYAEWCRKHQNALRSWQ